MAVSKMATGTDHIWTKNVISEHDTQQLGGQTESKMAAGPPKSRLNLMDSQLVNSCKLQMKPQVTKLNIDFYTVKRIEDGS